MRRVLLQEGPQEAVLVLGEHAALRRRKAEHEGLRERLLGALAPVQEAAVHGAVRLLEEVGVVRVGVPVLQGPVVGIRITVRDEVLDVRGDGLHLPPQPLGESLPAGLLGEPVWNGLPHKLEDRRHVALHHGRGNDKLHHRGPLDLSSVGAEPAALVEGGDDPLLPDHGHVALAGADLQEVVPRLQGRGEDLERAVLLGWGLCLLR
mmetsp:Transcript_88783/g.276011  ORF Transcript_88783/g.276011 Transcript_88783/m.276011 type:complete len:206 (-) Transcript_88783:843-1460(-)